MSAKSAIVKGSIFGAHRVKQVCLRQYQFKTAQSLSLKTRACCFFALDFPYARSEWERKYPPILT